ncbi:hypothetical protein GCM10010298_42850 [Streptomyces microflavus]|uniref:Uncharacterized protein n=1 Tax=Streptomyces microflavus TaxID=1919 RepID=A0A7J0CTL8_STRMI|nr:hypothetical protein Smic_44170 [Streptomyces microflavus]GGX73417.1 hypothetical protein GCM10010298_42850 [Streptomyces microflavus]
MAYVLLVAGVVQLSYPPTPRSLSCFPRHPYFSPRPAGRVNAGAAPVGGGGPVPRDGWWMAVDGWRVAGGGADRPPEDLGAR